MILSFLILAISFQSQSLTIHSNELVKKSNSIQNVPQNPENQSIIYQFESDKLVITGVGSTYDLSANKEGFTISLSFLYLIQMILCFTCFVLLVIRISIL